MDKLVLCKRLSILAVCRNLRAIPDKIWRLGLVRVVWLYIRQYDSNHQRSLEAYIIEKHFTLDRNAGGPDYSFSLEPADLAALCRDSKTAWQALGKVELWA